MLTYLETRSECLSERNNYLRSMMKIFTQNIVITFEIILINTQYTIKSAKL